MNYKAISLSFQDLEELTFKEAAIDSFDYQVKNNQIHSFKLALIKDQLLKAGNVSARAFLKDQISWQGLEEYLLANNPSVEAISFIENNDEVITYKVNWLLLPNPSLQDCQCEPINANAYSKLEDNLLIVGVDEEKGLKADHYMAKEKG